MPYEITLDSLPAGVAMNNATDGDLCKVAVREFTSSEDGDDFIIRLEGLAKDCADSGCVSRANSWRGVPDLQPQRDCRRNRCCLRSGPWNGFGENKRGTAKGCRTRRPPIHIRGAEGAYKSKDA